MPGNLQPSNVMDTFDIPSVDLYMSEKQMLKDEVDH